MAKYIDADRLKAEIERFSAAEYGDNTFGDDVANGALDYVLEEIIPSIQQDQEVDLEKEMEEHVMHIPFNDFANDSEVSDGIEWVKAEFLHFYELGRKQVLQEIYDGKTKPVDKITAAWLND